MDNSALREEIKQLIEKIKGMVELMPEDLISIDSFLSAGDDELSSVHSTLTRLVEEITLIENQARSAEQKLLDEYLAELREITNKARQLNLEMNETIDHRQEQQKQEVILQELNQI